MLKRILIKAFTILLKPIEIKYPRFYMKVYIKLLSKKGVQFTGNPQFISSSAQFDTSDTIIIGERCVITQNCYFLTHDFSYTTGLISIGKIPSKDICTTGKVKLGNNIFIGMNSLILPNTTIEDNVIIGAGSLVKGYIKANGVYAGNPAKYISSIEEYTNKIINRQSETYINH